MNVKTETQLTRSPQNTIYTDETIHEYGLAYDGMRKSTRQIKFGVDTRSSNLDSNVSNRLDEQRYALYAEGS